MDTSDLSGYAEIPHTADWALRVWAPDLAGLIGQAVIGMYALMDVNYDTGPNKRREMKLSGYDGEGLMVSFLTELLWLIEHEDLVFRIRSINLEGFNLTASLEGSQIISLGKEIKAVTYHNLLIKSTPFGLESTLVFDV
jgi:SHS2 domain-containing protein